MNFFDNAEAYAGGESERIMGEAIAELGWPRHSYVISTKLFWGIHGGVNMRNTLNRKYLLQAIDGSLERLGLDFVDLLYCHRADPNTPIEETVWAMSDIVSTGQAHVLGHVGVDRRRDPRRVGDRRAPPPAQAGRRAAAVQPAQPPAGRARVRPALRGHRPRPHHLEPARVRPAHRQVPRRRARRHRATLPGYEWLARCSPTRVQRQGPHAAGDRGRAGLLARAAGHRWCAKNPTCRRDHRREPAEQVPENLGALDVLARSTTT